MKNKNKLIISLVLGASVVTTFGVSYALYQNVTNAPDQTITIGGVATNTENTGVVNYAFGELESWIYDSASEETNKFVSLKDNDQKLNPQFNQIKINAPLTFSYDETASAFAQSYAVGRLNVSITINEALPAGTKAYAYLNGYDTVSGTSSWFYNNKKDDFFETTFTATEGESTKVEKHIDTAIPTSGITLEIVLDFSSSITADNFLSIAEVSNAYSVQLTWGGYKTDYTDFDTNLIPTAYIAGTHSEWKDWAQYELVPNVKKNENTVEWMYTGLKGASLLKIHDNYKNSWVTHTGGDATAADDGNDKVDVNETYDIYYTRGGDNNSGYSFYIGKQSQD